MEAWVNVNRTINPSITWGNVYYGNINSVSYGVTFIDVPMVIASVRSGGLWIATGYPNKTETGLMYAVRPGSTSANSATYWVSVYAVGRWK